MKLFGMLAMLSAIAFGEVSHGEIQVWVRDRDAVGTVPVRVTGAVVAQGNHVSFTTQNLANEFVQPNNLHLLVWVFDSASTTGDPVESIGSITIDATPGTYGNDIRLLVAPAPITGATRSQSDFRVSWTLAMPFAGALNIGPITVMPSSFEPLVSVSVAVGGDVGADVNTTGNARDEIKVGQIYRLQADGRTTPNGFVGGNIHANAIATARDSFAVATSRIDPTSTTNLDEIRLAIGAVTAAQSIQGRIEATGEFDGQVRAGSIDSVRITLSSQAVLGITGSILAERGRINQILTTGKIGTNASAKSQIRAGRGITEIRAISGGQVLNRDFFADVKANVGEADLREGTDSIINKLETDGDFVGSIQADYIRSPIQSGEPGLEWGVFVGGSFTGDIRVRHSVAYASLAAGTFVAPSIANPNTGHIFIDHSLDGAVVATSPTGQIPFITIGRSPVTDVIRPGFLGSNSEPQTTPFLPWQPAPFNQPQPDSVIAASMIGTIDISHMVQAGDKRYAPRIESPDIKTLIIGDLREGVVWSGRLEYVLDSNGNPTIDLSSGRPILQVPQDDTNDYSQIAEIKLDCVSAGGDVYYFGTPLAEVTKSMVGELHVPSLSSLQQIRIANFFGAGLQLSQSPCPCDVIRFTAFDCGEALNAWPELADPSTTDTSPRDNDPSSIAGILIAEANGLVGQVIINASNSPADPSELWAGQVIVGSTSLNPIILSPDSAAPYAAPYYTAKSSVLGGGSVGLAPFHLHENDCTPPHASTLDTDEVLESAFDNALHIPVHMRHYGPIRQLSGSTNWTGSVLIEANPVSMTSCDRWENVTSGFKIRGPNTVTIVGMQFTGPRTIGLSRATNAYPRPGVYRVVVFSDYFEQRVVSDDVQSLPSVVWPKICENTDLFAQAYIFTIGKDCDHDGIRDGIDPITDCAVNCGIANFNGVGGVTVQDLFDFLDAYFSASSDPCWYPPQPRLPADVNNSGCVTVQDIFDFLGAYFGVPTGSCQ